MEKSTFSAVDFDVLLGCCILCFHPAAAAWHVKKRVDIPDIPARSDFMRNILVLIAVICATFVHFFIHLFRKKIRLRNEKKWRKSSISSSWWKKSLQLSRWWSLLMPFNDSIKIKSNFTRRLVSWGFLFNFSELWDDFITSFWFQSQRWVAKALLTQVVGQTMGKFECEKLREKWI